jgi:hypothetical protein
MSIADLKDACEEVAPVVLTCLVHSSVRRLECIPNFSHPECIDYHKAKDCDLMYKALLLLQDLRELSLGYVNRTDDMKLEVEGSGNTSLEFSSRSCLNADVETLVNNCKQLRCLDISSGHFVTDSAVEHILKFEHLEELNLCEVNLLSEKGLLCVLNGLAEVGISESEESLKDIEILPSCSTNMSDSREPSADASRSPVLRSQLLKSFGCNGAIEQHICLIAQKFSNLTSLALSDIQNSPLTPLKDLKHLENFTLKRSSFSLAREILTAIGNQLKWLNIADVAGTDFIFIWEKCTSFLCLHLLFAVREDLSLPQNYKHSEPSYFRDPDFCTILNLQLSMNDILAARYIVSRFLHFKKLCMRCSFGDGTFFEDILSRTIVVTLREFFWGDSIVVIFLREVTLS